MSELSGKVALVTGAGRGLGRATAVRLAELGADVAICDLCAPIGTVSYGLATRGDLEETARMVRALGSRCHADSADVRDRTSMDRFVRGALEQLGRVDIGCANAGVVVNGPFWELTAQQWNDSLAVNLTGVWNFACALAPSLIAQQSGNIVVIGSTNSRLPSEGAAAYTAAKHGVIGLMKAMALELGPHNVRVNAVLPSRSATAIVTQYRTGEGPDPRRFTALRDRGLLPPEAVAEAVAWLASDRAEHVTGAEIVVDAGRGLLPGHNPHVGG